MKIEQFEQILDLSPGILFLGILVLIALIIAILIFGLPLLHRYVEQLKVGNNEVKFRPFPTPDTASLQDIMDEIKSLKTADVTDENYLFSLQEKVCWCLHTWRADLSISAMHLSLLLTAMERPDVKSGLGKDKEKIMQKLYERLDHEIGKYFLLEDGIIKFAKCVDKEKEFQKKLENDKETAAMLEFHKQIPDHYRKFDYQKFLEEKS
jgi:hypothetical protein